MAKGPLSQAEIEQRREAAKARWAKRKKGAETAGQALGGAAFGGINAFGAYQVMRAAGAAEAIYPDNPDGRIKRAILRNAKKDRASLRQVYQATYRQMMDEHNAGARTEAGGFFGETPAGAPRAERMARAAERKLYEESLARGEPAEEAAQAARAKGNQMRGRAGLSPAPDIGGGLQGAEREAAESASRAFARGRLRQFYDFAYEGDIKAAAQTPRARRVLQAALSRNGRIGATVGVGVASGAAAAAVARANARVQETGEEPSKGHKIGSAASVGTLTGLALARAPAMIYADMARSVPSGFRPQGPMRRNMAIAAGAIGVLGAAGAAGGAVAGYRGPEKLKQMAIDKWQTAARRAQAKAKRDQMQAALAEFMASRPAQKMDGGGLAKAEGALSEAEVKQRRDAAKARWKKWGATGATLGAGLGAGVFSPLGPRMAAAGAVVGALNWGAIGATAGAIADRVARRRAKNT